jgi:hypothetical protein
MKPLIAFAMALSLLPILLGETFTTTVLFARSDYDAKILRVSGCDEIRVNTSSCRISVHIENSGATDWDGGHFRLDGRIVRGPSGSPVQREELAHNNTKVSLESKRRDHFTYEVEGTSYIGTYQIEWCMAHTIRGYTRFGSCLRRTITIVE